MPSHPLTVAVREGLHQLADPAKAPMMEKYMKYQQPFLGVQAPRVISLVRRLVGEFPHPDFSTGEAILRELWQGPWREERQVAMRMAALWPAMRIAEVLPLYRWMIVSGAWWDLVDYLAVNMVGGLLRMQPQLSPTVFAWIEAEEMWLRRTALLCQLKFKGETDREALARMVLKTAHEQEFFIRKAIGWALREYSKTEPDFVRAFVAQHEALLSPLSRREALKHLARQE